MADPDDGPKGHLHPQQDPSGARAPDFTVEPILGGSREDFAISQEWANRARAPLFTGPSPASYAALISECETLTYLTNQRPIDEWAERQALQRLYGAMGQLAPDKLLPYPARFSRAALDQRRRHAMVIGAAGSGSHVERVNLDALRRDAATIKDWCLARMHEEGQRSVTRGDGTHPPNLIRLNNRETTLEPIPWRLVEFMWTHETASGDATCRHVWGQDEADVGIHAVKNAIKKANASLRGLQAEWKIGTKSGHFVKKRV
jgi:hypothetical protein